MTEQNTLSISELQQQANAGDALAQLGLACYYNYLLFFDLNNKEKFSALGTIVSPENINEALAFEWLKKAVEQGCAEAQYLLARCYFNGQGIGRNSVLGIEWLKKAAEQGNAEAQCYLSNLHIQGFYIELNDALAFECLEKAAERGVAEAQYRLALCYFEGKGVEQNDDLAFEWLKKAAEQGNAEAQYRLAHCYFEGKDVEQNYEFAYEWFEKSARQGNAEAFYWLGYIWEHGLLVDEIDDNYCNESAFINYENAVKQFECKQEESEIKYLAFKALADCLKKGKGFSSSNAVESLDNEKGNSVNPFIQKAEQLYQKIGREKLAQLDEEEILTISPHSRKAIELLYQRIAIHISKGEFDLAKQFVEEVFKNSDYKGTSMKEIAMKTIEKAEENVLLYKALHEKEKEMLSFFTHTMRNALTTAPESLRQAIHLLGSEVYEKDTKHYQAINKIAALFSTLSLTDCLIDTFKQSISDPQEFKQSWQKDHTGEATPRWVIASALRQSLNRIIFMSDTSELRKLLNNPETALIKATRKSFIEEVLPLNVDNQGVDVFYAWALKHIPAIEVSIVDNDKLNFGVNQTRFSLLFAITSELILNALKYWDGENRIQISWQLAEQDNYVFSVKNHCKVNAASNLAGTHKGLPFIKRLVELLGEQAHFVCKSEDQLFTAELILNKALFDGES
ncbi:MAG: tetratricopeptide repeat protein [Methylobacter sp.]